MLAESGEQAPLDGGEAERKWMGPWKCDRQGAGSMRGWETEPCGGRRSVLRAVGEVVGGSRVCLTGWGLWRGHWLAV